MLNIFIQMTFGIITIYAIFRIFPNQNVSWKSALTGAVICTTMIEVAKHIFAFYLGSAFANYGAVYGSLAWIVALAFWAYLVGVMFFFGAEIAAELERRKIF